MLHKINLAIAALFLTAIPAAAEWELSFYLGVQEVSDSDATGALPDGTAINRNISWAGESFKAPLYYGGRATWWNDRNIGFGVEGTHTKAVASSSDTARL